MSKQPWKTKDWFVSPWNFTEEVTSTLNFAKEIKMRPSIDAHDYDVKMRSIQRFLGEGDKVKVTLRFRGREMAHQDRAMQMMERVRGDIEEIAKVEQFPKMEGRQMIMVVAPK